MRISLVEIKLCEDKAVALLRKKMHIIWRIYCSSFLLLVFSHVQNKSTLASILCMVYIKKCVYNTQK